MKQAPISFSLIERVNQAEILKHGGAGEQANAEVSTTPCAIIANATVCISIRVVSLLSHNNKRIRIT